SGEEITYYLQNLLTLSSMLDILLVTLILFGLMQLLRGTRAMQVARGFFFIVVISFVIFALTPLRLPALNWLLNTSLPALLLAIPVIFQPELRRALERLGGAGSVWRFWQRENVDPMIEAITIASRRLSQRRHGALIVFEQETGLREYIDTGVALNAAPSPELLLTVFNKNTELHDGAVIVQGNVLAAAACVMPLSTSNLSDRQLGLRHRAGLGISEVSDAVALIVSEETGHIAIAHNGRILRRQDPDQLDKILLAFLQSRDQKKRKSSE
ncbi:MAG: diadenylate cyclase CdaA, partial [Anaerolineales bacterium]|nr:diadenylate cyclase CdaA [Anaerolineales bacterium]